MSPSVVGRLAVEKGMTEEPFGTDEALVEALKAGEQLAQLILVKRFGPRVKYLIPNGICHLVGQYLRFSLKGIALRT